jgi:hypothetical protein
MTTYALGAVMPHTLAYVIPEVSSIRTLADAHLTIDARLFVPLDGIIVVGLVDWIKQQDTTLY